jgi:hypothetical protein
MYVCPFVVRYRTMNGNLSELSPFDNSEPALASIKGEWHIA